MKTLVYPLILLVACLACNEPQGALVAPPIEGTDLLATKMNEIASLAKECLRKDVLPCPKNIKPILAEQPLYPTAACMGLSGRVKARLIVNKDGNVAQVQIIQSDNPAFFDQQVKEALPKWKYPPQEFLDSQECCYCDVTISFMLH